MAPHSSTLAWKIPWAEEPGRLQPMGSRRVGHDWATSLSLFTFMHWRRTWQPTPVFLPGESQVWGAWWAAIYGVAQSWTWLKWLSSSSSSAGQGRGQKKGGQSRDLPPKGGRTSRLAVSQWRKTIKHGTNVMLRALVCDLWCYWLCHTMLFCVMGVLSCSVAQLCLTCCDPHGP